MDYAKISPYFAADSLIWYERCITDTVPSFLSTGQTGFVLDNVNLNNPLAMFDWD